MQPSAPPAMLFFWSHLCGSKVHLQTKDGKILEGIFHTANTTHDIHRKRGIMLKFARVIKDPSLSTGEVPSMTYKWKCIAFTDFVQMLAVDVPFTTEDPSGASSDAHVDVETVSRDHARGFRRELQRWVPEEEEEDGSFPVTIQLDDCRPSREWDQFQANVALGVKESSYKEELYTTKIRPETRLREQEAHRIAREIEHGDHRATGLSAYHMAEERGLEVDDTVMDEESRYGAVVRDHDTHKLTTAAHALKGVHAAGGTPRHPSRHPLPCAFVALSDDLAAAAGAQPRPSNARKGRVEAMHPAEEAPPPPTQPAAPAQGGKSKARRAKRSGGEKRRGRAASPVAEEAEEAVHPQGVVAAFQPAVRGADAPGMWRAEGGTGAGGGPATDMAALASVCVMSTPEQSPAKPPRAPLLLNSPPGFRYKPFAPLDPNPVVVDPHSITTPRAPVARALVATPDAAAPQPHQLAAGVSAQSARPAAATSGAAIPSAAKVQPAVSGAAATSHTANPSAAKAKPAALAASASSAANPSAAKAKPAALAASASSAANPSAAKAKPAALAASASSAANPSAAKAKPAAPAAAASAAANPTAAKAQPAMPAAPASGSFSSRLARRLQRSHCFPSEPSAASPPPATVQATGPNTPAAANVPVPNKSTLNPNAKSFTFNAAAKPFWPAGTGEAATPSPPEATHHLPATATAQRPPAPLLSHTPFAPAAAPQPRTHAPVHRRAAPRTAPQPSAAAPVQSHNAITAPHLIPGRVTSQRVRFSQDGGSPGLLGYGSNSSRAPYYGMPVHVPATGPYAMPVHATPAIWMPQPAYFFPAPVPYGHE